MNYRSLTIFWGKSNILCGVLLLVYFKLKVLCSNGLVIVSDLLRNVHFGFLKIFML